MFPNVKGLLTLYLNYFTNLNNRPNLKNPFFGISKMSLCKIIMLFYPVLNYKQLFPPSDIVHSSFYLMNKCISSKTNVLLLAYPTH